MASMGAMVDDTTTTERSQILVVDDARLNREILVRQLRKHDFETHEAEEGERALQLIAARRFDLILLDIMMPGCDGIEILDRLRRQHSMSELPVILVTSKDTTEDVVVGLAHGANDYVTKPITFPVVLARVRTQLELRRAHLRNRALTDQLEARNRFIRETFGRYLTDEVVASLLETPQGLALGGETRTVTILISDLRGFSALAERIPPQRVIELLNGYLGVMTEIIRKHGGTIDEILGDAILVIFGAPTSRPDDARRAVACAVEMQLAMAAVNTDNRARELPALEMGIGVNTGEVVVGNIGCAKRAKYGAVGRNVNLASRIEAWSVGGQVLISEATLRAAGGGLRVDRSMELYPKGSKGPMRIHEVGGVDELRLPPAALGLAALAAPLPVRLYVLDGINVPASGLQGQLTHLARGAARIGGAGPGVHLMCSVKLEIQHSGGTIDHIYGKVVVADGSACTVRFTSVPPEAEAPLAALVAAAGGDDTRRERR
jgi:adenylate cyclase